MIPPGCRPRRSLSKRQYNFCVNAAPHHRRRQIAAPIWWARWLRMAGHLLSKGLLHGIRRNRRVSSLRRCRKLRRRHPRGLWHRPIDRLSSVSLATSSSERQASGVGPMPSAAGRRPLSRQLGSKRSVASTPNIECRAWRVGSVATRPARSLLGFRTDRYAAPARSVTRSLDDGRILLWVDSERGADH